MKPDPQDDENDALYGSLDFLEDAMDTLDQSGFSYFIVTGISPKRVRIQGNMSLTAVRSAREELESGYLTESLIKWLNDVEQELLENDNDK